MALVILLTSVDGYIDSKPCYDNCLKSQANAIYDVNYREIK